MLAGEFSAHLGKPDRPHAQDETDQRHRTRHDRAWWPPHQTLPTHERRRCEGGRAHQQADGQHGRRETVGCQPYRARRCLLYTSDAADDLLCVDPGGRRILKKKNNKNTYDARLLRN